MRLTPTVAVSCTRQSATFILTSDYAYGASGFPAWGIPPNASLTFEIELLSAK